MKKGTVLLTTKEVADRLKVSTATVNALVRQGELPSFRKTQKKGSPNYFEETEVDRYKRERKKRKGPKTISPIPPATRRDLTTAVDTLVLCTAFISAVGAEVAANPNKLMAAHGYHPSRVVALAYDQGIKSLGSAYKELGSLDEVVYDFLEAVIGHDTRFQWDLARPAIRLPKPQVKAKK